MKATCTICGEDYEYVPYEGWQKDYKNEADMMAEHDTVCGECQ